MGPIIRFTAIALAALSIGLSSCSRAEPPDQTFIGESAALGDGEIHSWAQLDAAGNPISIGVTFTEGMLSSLPPYDPAISLAMPEEANTTLFTHVFLEWWPNGHFPPRKYHRPHFDFHFYLIPEEERADIRSTYDTALKAQFVPQDYIPADGQSLANHGVHWSDPEAPEWNGEPFTETLIYGFSRGRMVFIEPMISKTYFQSKPDIAKEMKLPEAYPRSGYFPTSYSIRYDPDRGEYTIALEGFVSR